MFKESAVRAVVFDLDGTLVETEHLKAEAYAHLVGRLTGRNEPEPAAVELYRASVGATDMMICELMIEKFDLEKALDLRPGESSRDSLHRQRMDLYRHNYGTPECLREHMYLHNANLAREAGSEGLPVGVATMSYSDEASRVINAIGLGDIVSTIVGVEHVSRPKPSPDAFLLAMNILEVKPAQTLIIEDSPRGAAAAAASGARWLCVASEFSTAALKESKDLEPEWIVWTPEELPLKLARRISD